MGSHVVVEVRFGEFEKHVEAVYAVQEAEFVILNGGKGISVVVMAIVVAPLEGGRGTAT